MAAAERELQEETQLRPHQDVRLGFVGLAFSLVDEQTQRSWTTHPFGWTLIGNENDIKLDWEHDRWDWYSPKLFLSGAMAEQCVPMLHKSLKGVFFGDGGMFGEGSDITRTSESGMKFVHGIDALRYDRGNGARVLATNAVQNLKSIVEDMRVSSNMWQDLLVAGYHFIYSGRPSMNAAIGSAVLHALTQVRSLSDSVFDATHVLGVLDKCIAEREETSSRTTSAFTTFMKELASSQPAINILTLSSSSTIRSAILDTLTSCPSLTVNLFVLESRPNCEGASMTAAILEAKPAQSKLQVVIAPDSHTAHLARQLSASIHPSVFLFGADRISTSGHVSNKMGSCAAALLMKTFAPRSKTVVLSETDKIARPADLQLYGSGLEDPLKEMHEHSPESNDSMEVSKIWQAAELSAREVNTLAKAEVDIQNVYFEWVPAEYIDIYICENGTLSREQIRSQSLRKARQEQAMFGDLYGD